MESYVQLRGGDAVPGTQVAYRITVRQLEALIRLSEAIARLHHDEVVSIVVILDVTFCHRPALLLLSILVVEYIGFKLLIDPVVVVCRRFDQPTFVKPSVCLAHLLSGKSRVPFSCSTTEGCQAMQLTNYFCSVDSHVINLDHRDEDIEGRPQTVHDGAAQTSDHAPEALDGMCR